LSTVIIQNNKCGCEFEVWITIIYDMVTIRKKGEKPIYEFQKDCKVLNMCPSHEKDARNGLIKNIKKMENKEFYEAAKEYLLDTNNIIQ